MKLNVPSTVRVHLINSKNKMSYFLITQLGRLITVSRELLRESRLDNLIKSFEELTRRAAYLM